MSAQRQSARLEPVLSSLSLADEDRNSMTVPPILEEAIYPRDARSEPVWLHASDSLSENAGGGNVPMQRERPRPRRRAYRLIDWLTAIGFLVAGMAIAFALNPNLL